jgi:hypothetical protein
LQGHREGHFCNDFIVLPLKVPVQSSQQRHVVGSNCGQGLEVEILVSP